MNNFYSCHKTTHYDLKQSMEETWNIVMDVAGNHDLIQYRPIQRLEIECRFVT